MVVVSGRNRIEERRNKTLCTSRKYVIQGEFSVRYAFFLLLSFCLSFSLSSFLSLFPPFFVCFSLFPDFFFLLLVSISFLFLLPFASFFKSPSLHLLIFSSIASFLPSFLLHAQPIASIDNPSPPLLVKSVIRISISKHSFAWVYSVAPQKTCKLSSTVSFQILSKSSIINHVSLDIATNLMYSHHNRINYISMSGERFLFYYFRQKNRQKQSKSIPLDEKIFIPNYLTSRRTENRTARGDNSFFYLWSCSKRG